MMNTCTPAELTARLSSASPPVVLDVRLADDFAACHIHPAINNAVLEVAFHERLSKQLPDRTHAIVLYGAGFGSGEDCMAAEKLTRAGFAKVTVLEGGLHAWTLAGLPVTSGPPLPVPPPCPEGIVAVNCQASRISWTGRNLLNSHQGDAALKSGVLAFSGGQLNGGHFTVDLTKLHCTDLAGTELHDVLISHLQSDDFFDVDRFPEAIFVITAAAPHASTPGSPNLRIHGELTIKGRTHAIVFDAASGLTETGKAAAQAVFSIDRTLWSVIYGSGKFFHRLAGHLVNDLIEFQIRIVSQ